MANVQQTDPAEFTHAERIECPECGHHQDAVAEATPLFFIRVHDCEGCGYTIIESVWQRVEE